MTGLQNSAQERYDDCTDWLLRGPYRPFIDGTRMIGGVRIVRGVQPPGHYPDPPFADYSLIYTCVGRLWAETDFGDGRKRVEIHPGMMIVAPTDTACDYEKHGRNEQLIIGLPKARIVALAAQATGRPVTDLGPCHEFFRDPLIEAVSVRLWSEVAADNPYGTLFGDCALGAIVGALLYRAGLPPKEPRRSQTLSGIRLGRVLNFITEHLSEPVTLADLAAVAHLSEFHFARLFKRATGLPPHRYLVSRRVDRAKALLRDGRLSLATVAATVGFSSQSHLNRHFKRLVGCTPAEYRN